MDVNKLEILHSKDRERFYVIINKQEAYLQYRKVGPTMLEYYETFVPVEERRQGIGRRLVEEALRFAQLNDYRVVDTCPFVADYIDKNSAYQKIRVNAKEKAYYQSLPS